MPVAQHNNVTEKQPARTTPRTTLSLTDLLKVEPKKENQNTATPAKKEETSAFTLEQFEKCWNDFSAQRKKYQAEYQLLSQPFDLDGTKVTLHLLSPVQETMLANIKSELVSFLRDKLKNDLINVTGVVRETDDKKVMYTSRDKFEYLQTKIPVLKEFKERLGLDSDF